MEFYYKAVKWLEKRDVILEDNFYNALYEYSCDSTEYKKKRL